MHFHISAMDLELGLIIIFQGDGLNFIITITGIIIASFTNTIYKSR